MDWSKAKKTFIVILLILNTILLGLNYTKGNHYQLTQAQEKAAFDVLAKNGIGLYTDIIREYKPMSQLTVTAPAIGTEKLRQIFFDKDEITKITVEFNKTILKSQSKTLAIENNSVTLVMENGTEELQDLNENTARGAADRYMSSIGQGGNGFYLENIFQQDDYFIFEYFCSYKGNKVFSCSRRLTVNEKGVVYLEGTFYEPESFVGEKREICSPDEALLTFMHYIRNDGNQNGVFIDKMSIGYDFQETGNIAEGRELRLVPCYYIYVLNRQEPYIINAYTNDMKLDE